MLYLTGAYRRDQVPALVAMGVGVMLQPGNSYAAGVEAAGFQAWAADNGCFARGDRFDLDAFYLWLDRVPRCRLMWAVAPDVFPDAAATLARSLPVLRELRARGYRAAFVAQDGAEGPGLVPWADLDCLFLGGRTAWKLGAGARALVMEAKRRGIWAHMGRVNSARRLLYATMIGCDSADGTFLRFRNRRGGGDGVRAIGAWTRQMTLPVAP